MFICFYYLFVIYILITYVFNVLKCLFEHVHCQESIILLFKDAFVDTFSQDIGLFNNNFQWESLIVFVL